MKVTDRYIIYFDILGYKQLIKLMGENHFLQIIDAVLEETTKTAKREVMFEPGISEFSCRIFSDNILMYCDVPKYERQLDWLVKGIGYHTEVAQAVNDLWYMNYHFIHLGILMENAMRLQRKFIQDFDILIRGCVLRGTLYCAKDYIYGQGLIDAYHLENDVAKYPRLIIDEKLFEILSKISEKDRYFHRIPKMRKWDDGIAFIDYLNTDDHPNTDNYKFLKQHKTLIEQNLSVNIEEESIMEKYLWCKKYHNLTCIERGMLELIID